jgi:CRP-like cAMP-binding protein
MADTDIDFDLLIKAGGPVLGFKAGDIIFGEGDPAAELLVVKSGTVEIRSDTLGERSIFGEMVPRRPRSPKSNLVSAEPLLNLGIF